ncbi:MAG: hypothetical protein ABSF49_19040, partial [Roseiarcus sp.]
HGLAGESEELGKLVARYQIRQTKDDPLRAELKKAAPHAFRQPAQTALARARAAATRAPAMKAAVNAPLPAATGKSGENDWQEF